MMMMIAKVITKEINQAIMVIVMINWKLKTTLIGRNPGLMSGREERLRATQ